MRTRIIKALAVGILIWLVSASYAHYMSHSRTYTSYWSSNEGFLSSVWEKVSSGKLNIKAKAAIVVDAATGEVIYSKNADRRLPIASLTKLATVLVFMDRQPDLDGNVLIVKSDFPPVGGSKLYIGETITVHDCLHLCLMCSDNVSAVALARSTGLSQPEFVRLMNEKASQLGMDDTHFTDPTGLDAGNVSTARDYIKLIQAVYAHETISKISQKKSYQFSALNRNIRHTLYNTNRLLYSQWNVKGGKTGYISQSGYCLALDVSSDSGRRLDAVLLGAPSNHYRYKDASRLLAYAEKN